MLAVTPWTVRNAITMDKFIPISTGVGHTLLAGHQDDPYDSRSDFPEADLREKYEDLPFPERETKVEDEAMEEAIDFMFSHKRYEVRLVFEKLWHLYEDDDDALRWIRGPQAPLGRDGRSTAEQELVTTRWNTRFSTYPLPLRSGGRGLPTAITTLSWGPSSSGSLSGSPYETRRSSSW